MLNNKPTENKNSASINKNTPSKIISGNRADNINPVKISFDNISSNSNSISPKNDSLPAEKLLELEKEILKESLTGKFAMALLKLTMLENKGISNHAIEKIKFKVFSTKQKLVGFTLVQRIQIALKLPVQNGIIDKSTKNFIEIKETNDQELKIIIHNFAKELKRYNRPLLETKKLQAFLNLQENEQNGILDKELLVLVSKKYNELLGDLAQLKILEKLISNIESRVNYGFANYQVTQKLIGFSFIKKAQQYLKLAHQDGLLYSETLEALYQLVEDSEIAKSIDDKSKVDEMANIIAEFSQGFGMFHEQYLPEIKELQKMVNMPEEERFGLFDKETLLAVSKFYKEAEESLKINLNNLSARKIINTIEILMAEIKNKLTGHETRIAC